MLDNISNDLLLEAFYSVESWINWRKVKRIDWRFHFILYHIIITYYFPHFIYKIDS